MIDEWGWRKQSIFIPVCHIYCLLLIYFSHGSIFVPSTSRNLASHSGCAGHAGAVTKLPSM
jgi:hypothetical protein